MFYSHSAYRQPAASPALHPAGHRKERGHALEPRVAEPMARGRRKGADRLRVNARWLATAPPVALADLPVAARTRGRVRAAAAGAAAAA